MESWCFDSLEKGYLANETVSPWEFKDHFSCETNMLIPSQPTVGNPGFPEVGLAEDILRTQFPNDSGSNVFNTNGSVGAIVSPSEDTSNAISGVDDPSLNLSRSVVDSKCIESSLFDLKLGNKPNSDSSRTAPISSSLESSGPAKRARVSSFGCQTAYCRVYGCDNDLSSAKDYYKRHRVCEAHSKTAKVIVNGIEQRFCQQCSRFHLVAEFDNGKRSCRKRLAGHNERRRKSQGSSNGSASIRCLEMHGFPTSEEHRRNVNWGELVKYEDGTKPVQKSENTCTDTQHQRSALLQNTQGIVANLFQTNALMNEDFALLDGASSTVEDLRGTSDSSCALSLLSSQLHQVGNHNQTRHIRQEADGFFSGLVNSNKVTTFRG